MSYTIDDAPLTWRHYYITGVAALGQLIGTGLATLVSIVIPLYQILAHPQLSSVMQGVVGAMDLIGIMVGSTILGKLSDRYGYLFFFRLCPLLVCISAVLTLLFPSLWILLIALFFMGFGIGGEYSLDSNYISELMPTKWCFLMVGVAKAASALGNIGVAGICFLIVKDWTDPDLWPRLMWLMIALSGLMIILRLRWWESPKWLLERGETKQAEIDTVHFLGSDVKVTSSDLPPEGLHPENKPTTAPAFFRRDWKKIIFTGVPWACEGLGVYGIGVFLPILVMALGLAPSSGHASALMQVVSSIEITLWISCIILPGFILGLALINHVDEAKILWVGFFLSAISLFVLLLAYHYQWSKWISIVAFMAFELFLNMGPHLMTFVLPPKVYPVADRGLGSGIAASLGKLGAVIGVFIIPVLLGAGGSKLVLIVSILVMLLGGVITIVFNPGSNQHVAKIE